MFFVDRCVAVASMSSYIHIIVPKCQANSRSQDMSGHDQPGSSQVLQKETDTYLFGDIVRI